MSSERITAVFADGGTIKGNPSTIGGAYAWCHCDERGHRVREGSGFVRASEWPGGKVTNNATEFLALVLALEALPEGWSGDVCSDSKVTLGRLFDGWKMTGIPPAWVTRGGRALRRLGRLTPVQMDGHPTKAQLERGVGKRGNVVSVQNVWADRECGRQADLCLLESLA